MENLKAVIFIIGLSLCIVGVYFQGKAKRNVKSDITYSRLEKYWYVRMPPVDDLTELGKKNASKAGIFFGTGFLFIIIFVIINLTYET